MTIRVAVIGDIGGHLNELRTELVRLGAGQDGRLPDDLIVVQVGDLIHRGPDSDGVVALVDRYLRTQPSQWIQLIGNHEAHYLRPPAFGWNQRLRRESIRTLRRWWKQDQAQAATALYTDNEAFLVTHAGVTAAFWRAILGAPGSASHAADRINSLARASNEAIFRGGRVLDGKQPNPYAGPLWADFATELIPGWTTTPLPFSQIHGHTSLTDWRRGTMRTHLRHPTSIDRQAKHERVHLSGGQLIGIDPGHRGVPSTPWCALELRCRAD